jgi:hypothetical protein
MKRVEASVLAGKIFDTFSEPITKVQNAQGEIVPATKSQMYRNAFALLGVAGGLGFTSYEAITHFGQALKTPEYIFHHGSLAFFNAFLYEFIGTLARRGKLNPNQ